MSTVEERGELTTPSPHGMRRHGRAAIRVHRDSRSPATRARIPAAHRRRSRRHRACMPAPAALSVPAWSQDRMTVGIVRGSLSSSTSGDAPCGSAPSVRRATDPRPPFGGGRAGLRCEAPASSREEPPAPMWVPAAEARRSSVAGRAAECPSPVAGEALADSRPSCARSRLARWEGATRMPVIRARSMTAPHGARANPRAGIPERGGSAASVQRAVPSAATRARAAAGRRRRDRR